MPTLDQLKDLIATPLLILMLLMVVDFILGVVFALIRKEFKTERLTSYLQTDLMPILAWAALKIIIIFIPEKYLAGIISDGISDLAYITVVIKIMGSILKSISSTGIIDLTILGIDNPNKTTTLPKVE